MKLIKPDFNWRVEIEGITGSVPRPVSIDQSITGFDRLRTLRVYQFSEGVPVDGHAEEDEVFLVVLSGTIELKLSGMHVDVGPVRLNAPRGLSAVASVAYLPPGGEYRLVPTIPADVAYVRARPQQGRPPKVLAGTSTGTLLFDESKYAEILQARITTIPNEAASDEIANYNPNCERLIHIQHLPHGATATARAEGGEQLSISAWDTLALGPGERPRFQFSAGVSPMLFLFAASKPI